MTVARRTLSTLAALTAVAGCLLLGGCSGGSPSDTAPTVAGSTKPSSSPSISPTPRLTSTPVSTTAADVFDLAVGDCLNQSTGDTVSDVPSVDCAAPHELEVFYLLTLPDAAVYPALDELTAAASSGCGDHFAEYVGVPYEQSALAFTEFSPTETSWAGGDRTVTCVLGDPNGPTTGSAYGIAR
ncbi:septum formation family protein [Subtercola sp. Z020]|uniref:septum formation family protein n=1 Tax=Subtercola sp. Z020 TaxID=2080582 RepID=UPI00130E7D7E|nr:septum formation family protein [Subtercola sp. Z020]